MPDTVHSPAAHTGPSRRHSARLAVDGHVLARVLALNERVDMRNIGFGGFALASDIPIQPGDIHEVRAVTGTGLVCTVRARVIHCQAPTADEPRYISGWAVEPDPDSMTAMADIVDSLGRTRTGATASGEVS